ncbi:pyridoxal phosphate-dependent aminotransferase [Persicirhabdus sediminis]|uniref:Aminotransferase n=1 Tax=Persicirhabdus sediminis TaxID=454144 RepID=A0A8J7SJP5_9BACT|nr:pyridoxal phosphate-dependent aminotransferase [Persicirhabdus sediminis]MBK1790270.1 pyridoxal phosphate-dependent aminotransferase [Persicirhabdus sediminis]
MDCISTRVNKVSPSLTLSITNQAKAMKSRGEEVYGLAGGEPDQDSPVFVKEAAIEALNEGKTKYTPAAGIPELRQAIADHLAADFKVQYDATQVVVTSGAKQACFNAILAVVEEGDEVIIPAPYWVSYPEMVRLAGGVPVMVETTAENDWKITAEQFEDAMSPRTKMIIINTPGNPTGSLYSKEEIAAIGEVASYEDIIILADEIYAKLVYGENEHVSVASVSKEIYNLTITVNGFSKAYAMTGWRLGYAAAPKALASVMSKIQGHTSSNATTFAQYGALAALEQGKNFVDDLVGEYDVRRQFLYARLKAIPNVKVTEPKGAFYFLVDTTGLGLKSENLCDKLLTRYRVAVVPGIAFGNDHSIRISYCTTLDVLNEAITRFEEFCRAH